MQGLVESDGDQRSRPDSVGGVHEESTDDTCHTVTDKVGTKSDKNLIRETRGIALVVCTTVSILIEWTGEGTDSIEARTGSR